MKFGTWSYTGSDVDLKQLPKGKMHDAYFHSFIVGALMSKFLVINTIINTRALLFTNFSSNFDINRSKFNEKI